MPVASSRVVVVLAATLVACSSTVSGGGSGGGDAGGPPADPVTDASSSASTGGDGSGGALGGDGTGGAGGAFPLDCTTYTRCAGAKDGDPSAPCPAGTECIAYPGCLTPICIATDEACAAHCGPGSCEILESYPAQLGDCAGGVDGMDQLTCEDLQAELDVIQACTADDQCGRVLPGTSCGCTHDLVARNDLPVAVFEAMLAAVTDDGCFVSECDCPGADGFACVDGSCTWRYLE